MGAESPGRAGPAGRGGARRGASRPVLVSVPVPVLGRGVCWLRGSGRGGRHRDVTPRPGEWTPGTPGWGAVWAGGAHRVSSARTASRTARSPCSRRPAGASVSPPRWTLPGAPAHTGAGGEPAASAKAGAAGCGQGWQGAGRDSGTAGWSRDRVWERLVKSPRPPAPSKCRTPCAPATLLLSLGCSPRSRDEEPAGGPDAAAGAGGAGGPQGWGAQVRGCGVVHRCRCERGTWLRVHRHRWGAWVQVEGTDMGGTRLQVGAGVCREHGLGQGQGSRAHGLRWAVGVLGGGDVVWGTVGTSGQAGAGSPHPSLSPTPHCPPLRGTDDPSSPGQA